MRPRDRGVTAEAESRTGEPRGSPDRERRQIAELDEREQRAPDDPAAQPGVHLADLPRGERDRDDDQQRARDEGRDHGSGRGADRVPDPGGHVLAPRPFHARREVTEVAVEPGSQCESEREHGHDERPEDRGGERRSRPAEVGTEADDDTREDVSRDERRHRRHHVAAYPAEPPHAG